MKFFVQKCILALLAVCLLVSCAAAADSAEKTYNDFTYSVPYGNYAVILAYTGESSEIDIPEAIDGLPVESVSSSAFAACRESVTDATVPGSIQKLGSAFRGCVNLTAVTVREGVTALGADAFNGCSSLAEISLPSTLTVIGPNAFKDCASLVDLALPEGLTQIGSDAFSGCAGLSSLTLPASLERITAGALDGLNGLQDIHFEGTQEQWERLTAQAILPAGVAVSFGQAAEAPEAAEAVTEEEHITHQWVLTHNTATCTAAGEGAVTCSVCGKIELRKTEPLGHDFQAKFDDSTGRITLTCSRCQTSFSGEKINGARWEATEDAATVCANLGYHVCQLRDRTATCLEDGQSESIVCSACGALLQESHFLSKRNHWWRDWEIEWVGTCVNPGKMVRTCRHCGAKEEKPLDSASLSHLNSSGLLNYVAPTCSTYGYSGDQICSTCKQYVVRGTILPKNPNNHVRSILVGAYSPTCGVPGSTGALICPDCGVTLRAASVIPATGYHQYNAAGVCSVCGALKP